MALVWPTNFVTTDATLCSIHGCKRTVKQPNTNAFLRLQTPYLWCETKQSAQLFWMCVCVFCVCDSLIGNRFTLCVNCFTYRLCWCYAKHTIPCTNTPFQDIWESIFDPDALSHAMQIRRFSSVTKRGKYCWHKIYSMTHSSQCGLPMLWQRYTMQLIEIIFVAWHEIISSKRKHSRFDWNRWLKIKQLLPHLICLRRIKMPYAEMHSPTTTATTTKMETAMNQTHF